MTDSSSFTSLMALVDNHLSKTSVQAGVPDENNGLPQLGKWKLPSLTGPNETLSETRLSFTPGPRLPLPTLSLTESPIQEVLAKQVSNMLKAKEKQQKQEEEVARLARERENIAKQMMQLKMQEENDTVIDLVKAVQESMTFKAPSPPLPMEETMSSSSSFESLFEPKLIECSNDPSHVRAPTPPPLLPLKTDMSYILKEKIKEGRCSTFGKVLTSRLRPAAAPYLKEKVPTTKVVRFDFSTKSPCDLIHEKLRKPRTYSNHTYDLYSMFPDLDT